MIDSMKLDVRGDQVTVEFENPKTPLPWFSSAVDWAIQWFLGSGIWKFDFVREHHGETTILVMRGLVPAKSRGPAMSGWGTLYNLHKQGLFPITIPEGMEFSERRKGGRSDGWTMICMAGLHADVRLAELAYGLADGVTGLFRGGGTAGAWVGSAKLCQLKINLGMSEKELLKYITDPLDYSASDSLSDFPVKSL